MRSSNMPSVLGIGDHQRGDVFGDEFAQMIDVDLPARVRPDVFHFVAGDHRGGGIGAVRGVRNQNFLARIALALRGKRESAAGR